MGRRNPPCRPTGSSSSTWHRLGQSVLYRLRNAAVAGITEGSIVRHGRPPKERTNRYERERRDASERVGRNSTKWPSDTNELLKSIHADLGTEET